MPDASPLTTLALVRAIKGDDPDKTTNDAIYNALIPGASAAFLNFTNRKNILAASYTETVSGDGSQSLILRNTPIISIESLTSNGNSIPASSGYNAPGYALGDAGFSIELLGSSCFACGRRNVVVTYTAGYATVPNDVAQAVAEMVLWKKAKMPRIDLASQTLNGAETVSYNQSALPQSVKDVITQYVVYGGHRSR